MLVDNIASSGNDEFYTPTYAITPILEFIKPNSIIWCPFDTNESNFVKKFKSMNHRVIATHINTGQDFFKGHIKNYNYIISNPPYSKKGEVLERLFKLNKPFAMLLGVVGLFESKKRFKLFKENYFEIMYFNKRISYFKDYNEPKPSLNPPFSSVYICSKMLPKQIIFKEIKKI